MMQKLYKILKMIKERFSKETLFINLDSRNS